VTIAHKTQMIKKVIYLLGLLWRKPNVNFTRYHYHYSMVRVNGKKGCVQANVSREVGSRFGASIGKCSDVFCEHHQGNIIIPFCCHATGFSCQSADAYDNLND
jgi:hypothetical protein